MGETRIMRSRITMGLAGVALVGGICLGGAQTAVAAPAAGAAGADPQPQPQSADDPSTTSTVEQLDGQTTRTTTTTTGTAVSTDEKGATTTTTTETTDVEDRTAYGQQRVEDPSLPEDTEAVEQEGQDTVTTDRTVKTTTTTEQPFEEKVYKVVNGLDEKSKGRDADSNLYYETEGNTRLHTTDGVTTVESRHTTVYRFALVNVDDPSEVHYSDWNYSAHFTMTRSGRELTDAEIKQADEGFWNRKQKNNDKWAFDPDKMLKDLEEKVLGVDGTTVRVLDSDRPTAAKLAAMLGLDGNADEWSFAEDGKHLVRTTVSVEKMPTVTVPGQDEVVGYNPAKPATVQTPDDPAGPADGAAVTAAAAPAAQHAAPQAKAASTLPQTSDGLGAFVGAVVALPAALGLLAMALLKRRRA